MRISLICVPNVADADLRDPHLCKHGFSPLTASTARTPAPTFPTRQQERSQPVRKVVVVLQHQGPLRRPPIIPPSRVVAVESKKEGARPLV
ncbi:hypothetical protein LR48_Vigan01g059200 [Vigna angularis]|uniref:Uncharacterized protein n=1 Tax=Phaseolus angularis TaxID=3914 RepID=A0A0L9TKS9_PHAAN|nr:hypothetical protein LR48_Vigan01g059200 [Vigna angularis]